ncbi:prolyl hydroxylase family protein [Sphingorhabdus arenilitoris]|uniref:Prolyl hydroxylase family protein n=1 Tax=Sphingorhabdus arenilitoris TaxID=1490041 RepID=A0ABV8RL52_9SPHN
MEETLAPPKKFDPNNDPAKLSKISKFVTKRLAANSLVVDVEAPGVQLYVYQGFLGPADCKILIDKIDADAVPSTLYKGTEQAGFRTSYSCHLSRWDPDVGRIEARMSDVLGIDNDFAETMQGQRYQVGQEFKAHHDFFHPAQDYWQQEGPAGGQRSWTAMIFLNEPEEGGNTEFPNIGIGVRPQAGMLLIWNNMNMDGTLNYKTLHSGTPVQKGTKYIITKWYRQNNWLELTTPKS